MKDNTETRIKPNFINLLKEIFGSNAKKEYQRDVSEMSDAEIEEILKGEDTLLLKTYKGVSLQEKVTDDSVRGKSVAKIEGNNIDKEKPASQDQQRECGGFEIGD